LIHFTSRSISPRSNPLRSKQAFLGIAVGIGFASSIPDPFAVFGFDFDPDPDSDWDYAAPH